MTAEKPYAPLAIAGLSFWFLLAFPFANHNESYAWLPALERATLADVLSRPMPPVVTFRPLGVALAWIAYRSSGSIYLIEALNFVLAAAAWILLLAAVPAKRSLSFAALVVQGVFFSGYIYLFHLHGVFYSPLLLQIAALFHLHARSDEARARSERSLAGLSLAAIILSLIHPFALLLQLAFAVGLALERRVSWRAAALASAPVALVLAVVAGSPGGGGSVAGLLVSYRMIEVNAGVSLAALVLVALSIAAARVPRRGAFVVAGLAGLAAIGCALGRLPMVLLWLGVSLGLAAAARRWAIAALLAAASFLPYFTGTGSPSYCVFALMVAAGAAAQDEIELRVMGERVALAVGLAPIALSLVLRVVPVPFAAKAIGPLLAEKEKTFQMESVLGWLEGSEYAACGLELAEAAPPPSAGGNAVRRDRRPPTQQMYLDAYLGSRVRASCPPGGQRPWVAFGGAPAGEQEVHVVHGRFAGDAVVYLPRSGPRR